MLSDFIYRLRALFRRESVEAEMNEELRFHLEHEIEKRVAAGQSRHQAERTARLAFGGAAQIQEDCRQARGVSALQNFLRDVHYAFRLLRKNPVSSLVCVFTLALGVGANTAVFSAVDAILLRPLPYADPDRLVVILHNGTDPVATANYLDWRSQNSVFEKMAAAEYWTANLNSADQPEKLWALHMSADIFPTLGVQPLLGRVFSAEEERPGKNRVVVLSYGSWQRHFGGDPSILNKIMVLDGETYSVIGVMPPGFRFAPFWATKAELWTPLNLTGRAANRGDNSLRVFARLKRNVGLDQARAELATITARLEQQFPGTNKDVTVTLLKEKVVGNVRPALLVLLSAVGFVLLIACANVAHVLLARAATRQREIAVRTALGARRSRLLQQFLTENLILALLGGGLGVLLAAGGIRLLVALSPAGLPRAEDIELNAHLLIFALLVSIATVFVFGLIPALQGSRMKVSEAIKEGGRTASEGGHRNRMHGLLVASELALALVLLVGAGLMVRSFIAIQSVDAGFNPHHVLSLVVSLTGSQSAQPSHRAAFFQELLQKVQTLPGVDSASAINHVPLAGDIWGQTFWIEGRPALKPDELQTATYRVVMPGYFHTMNIPLLHGSDITANDNLKAPGKIIVNEWFAQHYWPGEDAVGKRISLNDPAKKPVWLTVTAVAKNTIRTEWTAPAEAEMYLPYLQTREYLENRSWPFAYLTFVARTSGDPAALASAVRHEAWALDKKVAVSEIETMDLAVADSTAAPRFNLFLLGTFALVALSMAGIGIYGVISYSVSRRTHEIGIRMSLGAKPGDVLRLVVGQGMRFALLGATAGLVGALAITRLMSTLLYRTGASDPLTFLLVTLILTTVALLASYIPARRATRIDPMMALRHE